MQCLGKRLILVLIIEPLFTDENGEICRKCSSSVTYLRYHEYVDIEGDATELITFRAFGTAVRLSHTDGKVAASENIMHHVLSLKVLPDIYNYKCGVVVCARSAQVLADDSDAATIRKKFFFLWCLNQEM